jgi:hypothetical protein
MRTGEFYVYAYLRKNGTPYYVGKGKEGRAFINQRRCVSTPKDLNRILFLKKNLSEEKAFEFEKYMIFVLGRKDKGTGILRNLTDGGEGPSGYTHTEESRQKMSKSRTGKVLSEKTRRKLSDALKGKPVSENTIRASVEAKKGKPLTKEHCRKISEGRRGIPAHNKGKTGGTLSEETRRRMSEAQRGHPSYTAGLNWFVNDLGETALAPQSPGPEWQRGRKWK